MLFDAGSVLALVLGSLAAVVVPYLQARRAAPLSAELPYIWGAYCGFAELLSFLASAVQVLLYGIEALTGTAFQSAFLQGVFGRIEGRPELVFAVLGGTLAIPAGVGLLSRRRYGVWALFAVFLIYLVRMLYFVGGVPSPRMVPSLSVLVGVAAASKVYFSKRWALLA